MPEKPDLSPMERRKHERLARDERLFIQFAEVPAAPALQGHTESTRCCDVSAGGLCLGLSRPVPRDSRVELWVSIEGREGKYYLSGHVAWCAYKPGHERYEIGVSLHAARGTDFARWARLFG